jgi:hypothetical protein
MHCYLKPIAAASFAAVFFSAAPVRAATTGEGLINLSLPPRAGHCGSDHCQRHVQ